MENTYDAVGNKLTTKDGKGNTVSWVYDNLNRVIEEKDQLQNSEIYDYDKAGNKIRVTNRNNETTNFSYDRFNRLTKVTDTDRRNRNNYDNFNQLSETQVTTGSSITMKYDGHGDVVNIIATTKS